MGEKEMKLYIRFFSIFFAFIFLFTACEKKKPKPFSYKEILRKEFVELGKVVPLTIDQASEIDGCISGDGQYFFYASDKDRGNFDIYLRSMLDITTVRVTNHPSRDTAPAISPNGKYLAFVSEREDPEGDIYVVRISPEKLIEEAVSSITEIPSLDSDAKNITQYQDPVTGTVKIIRDASPNWSPDGKWIVFSSNRDGLENIWMMDRKGKNMRQLTRKGGISPKFSADGRHIVYISYRDKEGNGDIFTLNIDTGQEKQITKGPDIEMSPAFMAARDEIVYTLIDRDTNGNGKLDLKDNSVLYYRNLKTGMEYPLTLYSQISFNPQPSQSLGGVVVYCDQNGQNININIIPNYGVIPKRQNARQQYDLAQRYLKESDDTEKHLLCLERAYHFFGSERQKEFLVYIARSLADEAIKYHKAGDRTQARRINKILSSLSKDKTDYRNIMSRYLDAVLDNKAGDKVLLPMIDLLKNDKANNEMVPYLMEDLGDEYRRLDRIGDAAAAFSRILKNYTKYKRALYINYKLALYTYNTLQRDLSPSYIEVLGSEYMYEKHDVIVKLINIFLKERDLRKRLNIVNDMLVKYRDKKTIFGLLKYITGCTYYEMNDYKQARLNLKDSLNYINVSDILIYKVNILLGDIAGKEKQYDDFAAYYAKAINPYRPHWRAPDIRQTINSLVNFYEEFGERAEFSGNYRDAAKYYKSYVDICTTLHLKVIFEDIYNRYAARAHILYIDAYTNWKGDNFDNLSKMEQEYLGKDDKIIRQRTGDFDKAHFYGLGYIYAKMAVASEQEASALDAVGISSKQKLEHLLDYFNKAIKHMDWALFIDDTFIDPYLLKGWIYQYVDQRRKEDKIATGGKNEGDFSKFFPRQLWEKNIELYERALAANNENDYPEKEGNLHLNTANTYFLLMNYPRALYHYEQAKKFKKTFNSKIEEAMFHYHIGYCYWQNNQYENARSEMNTTLYIYRTLSSGKNARLYKNQIFCIYRFFAMLSRLEKNYSDAIRWFNTILDFSSQQSIKTDQARYMQEIAYCYKELGETDKALAYLDKAEKLLSRYSDDEKKYYLKIKFFALGPFKIYDLGPDKAVIGENKIFTELNTINKRQLNLSMQEEIFFDRGNYVKSVEYLKKKLSLIEKRENRVDFETHVRTLNNIGFCYFKVQNFQEARNNFQKAWDFAALPEVNDLQGAYMAIINLANLYAFMLENNIVLLKNPVSEIDALIKHIAGYHDSYEKKRFDEEFEKLKKEAKSRKRDISAQETQDLKKTIQDEAVNITYTVNIALGVLKYYKAEMIYYRDVNPGKNLIESSFNLYENNRELFDLYLNAKNSFETALINARLMTSKRLQVKLLMNISACQQRMGMKSEAYEAFGSAEKIVKQYRYTDLEWSLDYDIASFLVRYGEALEGRDYQTVAGEYFSKSLRIIEDIPMLYAGSVNRIRNIYDDYISFLVKKGEWNGALAVLEKKYAVARIMLIRLAMPDFSEQEDNELYKKVSGAVSYIDGRNQKWTQLIEIADEGATEKIAALQNELNERKKELKDITAEARKNRPVPGSYISLPDSDIRGIKNTVIYRFYLSGERVYGWRITQDGILFKDLGSLDDSRKENPGEKIKQFLVSDNMQAIENRFIVLDDSSLEIFLKRNINLDSMRFVFTQSIERVKYYISQEASALYSIYFNGKGLSERLAKEEQFKDVYIKEEAADERDYALYPVIIDGGSRENEISSYKLFRNRTGSDIFIKNIHSLDPDQILLLSESALYSRVKSLVLCKDLNIDDIAAMTKKSAMASLDTVHPEINAEKFSGICIGFRGADESERNKNLSMIRDSAYKNFLDSFNKRNFEDARIYLNRWKDLSKNDLRVKIDYLIKMAEIETANDDRAQAIKLIESAQNLSLNNFQDAYLKALSYRIYLLLYAGDINAAKILIVQAALNPDFISTGDYSIHNAIVKLVSREQKESLAEYNRSLPLNCIIPRSRLYLLYAEYLNICNKADEAGKILADINFDFPLSDRELCKLAGFSNRITVAFALNKRIKEITGLKTDGDNPDITKEKLTALIEKGGQYDPISSIAATLALQKLISSNMLQGANDLIGSIDMDEMTAKSYWMDLMGLLNIVNLQYSAQEKYGDSLTILKRIAAIIKDRALPDKKLENYYDTAEAQLRLKYFKESYVTARTGEAMAAGEDGDLYVRYQLLLMENEVSDARFSEAEERILKFDTNINDEYLYVFYLLKARNDLGKVYKKKGATEEELKEIELGILRGLDVLDRSPYVLNRFNRIELVCMSIDFLISYKFSRNDYIKALEYAEVKKQLLLRSKFSSLFKANPVPGKIIAEFKGIKDRIKEGDKYVGLLNDHPLLQAGAITGALPVQIFQRQIGDDCVVLYLVRNEADIFAWIISSQSIENARLKEGYLRVRSLEEGYRANISDQKNILDVSRGLYELLRPLENYFKSKKRIVFVTDRELEQVPFEIMGEKDMLDESHAVVYLSSIISSLRHYNNIKPEVSIVDSSRKSVTFDLERVAIRQSGISYGNDTIISNGISHIFASILYNPQRGEFILDGKPLTASNTNGTALYLPGTEFAGLVGYNDLSGFNSMRGVRAIIMNDASIHDINSAFFIDGLYSELRSGGELIDAFRKAKNSIRKRDTYNYPAYWAGIRLYLNSLE